MIEQLYHGHPLIDQRRYDKQIIKTKEDPSISQRNKELILQFAENCLKSSHRPKPLRHKRVIKYLACLRQLSLHLNKDFDKATREDIKTDLDLIGSTSGNFWRLRQIESIPFIVSRYTTDPEDEQELTKFARDYRMRLREVFTK